MFCIAAMDAAGKILTDAYPIFQILAVRFAVFFAVALMLRRRAEQRLGRKLASEIPLTQVARSLVLVVEVSLFILAFSSSGAPSLVRSLWHD